ncbi:MAG TPA: hypothetical protein VEX35_07410 [Allosphingosinicella sp.]|nr:hypothetical protein [Allosphingosinicella sp.]
MRGDKDPGPDRGADGLGWRLPVIWQEWALVGIFIGFLAAAQLLIPRSSQAYFPAFGVGAAIFLAICARRTRFGRRWLEWLKAALPDEPGARAARQEDLEKREDRAMIGDEIPIARVIHTVILRYTRKGGRLIESV